MQRAEAIERFKHLTETVLPGLARQGRWPIRLDHCFKRICLDHAFGDVWHRHIPRPAQAHLSGEPLARALACAESLSAGDAEPGLLDRLNRESLGFRGKLKG